MTGYALTHHLYALARASCEAGDRVFNCGPHWALVNGAYLSSSTIAQAMDAASNLRALQAELTDACEALAASEE